MGQTQPQLDLQQDWMLSYSREENGVTTLGFYRQRDTKDAVNDTAIQVKTLYLFVIIILASCKLHLVDCYSIKCDVLTLSGTLNKQKYCFSEKFYFSKYLIKLFVIENIY